MTVEPVVWTSVVGGVTVDGSSISKTSGCNGCADAGAVSQQEIVSGDGYVEFTISNVTADRVVGISTGNPGTSGSEIAFAFRIGDSGIAVHESGVYKGADTTLAAGDVLRIAVVGGVVKYFKNGVELNPVGPRPAPTYPLLVDTSLWELGSDVQNAVIGRASGGGTPPPPGPQPVVWTSVVNATVNGNSISKTSGCNGCADAGAVSQQQIASGDGYVEFTVTNAVADRFVGLSNGNPGTSGSEIDFAFYIDGGSIHVKESGIYKGGDSTVVAGDVLRIAVVGGVVIYSKNGTVLYTSLLAPVYPLLVDTALFEVGSDVQNAVISGAQ